MQADDGTRGNSGKHIIMPQQAYFNIQAIGTIWKPWICSFKWGMEALSTIGSSYVTAKNVELTCMRPAQLKNMLKNSYLFKKNSKTFNQQIAQISPFQMRYDSLLNSMKWPSDSQKGSATPCFLPTLSVVLFCLLPNHPFSKLGFSGLIILLSGSPLVHCELARNKGCWTFWSVTWPFLGIELATIPHLKEGCLGYLLIKKVWNFFKQIAIFKHIFE